MIDSDVIEKQLSPMWIQDELCDNFQELILAIECHRSCHRNVSNDIQEWTNFLGASTDMPDKQA